MGRRFILAGLAAGGLFSFSPASPIPAHPRPVPLLPGPITHVVIIDQENRSFDHTLARLCMLATAGNIQRDPCDGTDVGTLGSGKVIPLLQAADISHDLDHTVAGQQKAIDGGKMDGFSKLGGCGSRTNYQCYSSYDPSQIPNLAALATEYALSDRTFEFGSTPSWGGHLVLGSATLDGFTGDNPEQSTFTTQHGPAWGCDSFKDGLWWNGSAYVREPSCVPDQAGNGPYRTSPVPYVPTIFGRLDAAGLSWKIYGGGGGAGGGSSSLNGYGWTICPTFYECLGSTQRANLVPASNIIADAGSGALPAYSVVTPTSENSQHPPQSMAVGDNWIGQVVSAIQNGPNWNSTAIFITYDDCGCYYDHVNPLQFDSTWGVRVPMVIVSPYAKPGYTDSTPASFLSMLAFTEHTFGLTPLTSDDANAYDFSGSFNFTAKFPRPPLEVVTTRIPRWEVRWLARHPMDPSDPT
jgi:phospholipase C